MKAKDPAEILTEMAETFKERNADYGNNYKFVGPIMKILFPFGANNDCIARDQFHLLELIIVKLSRYAISNMTHADSIHDVGVYAAMIESITVKENNDNE